jgi:hypothetical protein
MVWAKARRDVTSAWIQAKGRGVNQAMDRLRRRALEKRRALETLRLLEMRQASETRLRLGTARP